MIVSCLHGCHPCKHDTINTGLMLVHCGDYDAGPPSSQHCVANFIKQANAVLMLVHRLRRWTSIKTALVYCTVFAGYAVAIQNNYQ